jgi:hypothetical protein
MQPGDLVKITRPGIGVPKETTGLILNTVATGPDQRYDYHEVQLCNSKSRVIRRLERDLEVISEG